MEKIQKLESFKNFEISQLGMSKVHGQRSKEFKFNSRGECAKEIDNHDHYKIKVKARYKGKCG